MNESNPLFLKDKDIGVDPNKLILSMIFPVYNEEENLYQLYNLTKNTLNKLFHSDNNYELIFVDDCSSDKSLTILKNIQSKDARVEIAEHSCRKFHALAIDTGLKHVGNSQYTIIMNADLQYNPKEIYRFLLKVEEGYDIINGKRIRRSESFLKVFISILYNFLIKRLMRLPISDNASNYTLYRSNLIKNLNLKKGDQRYLISTLFYLYKNVRLTEIPIENYPRKHGISKYNVFDKMIYGFPEFLSKWRKIYINRDFFDNININKTKDNKKILSIIIPIRNEMTNICSLIRELEEIFIANHKVQINIIVIDDYSSDESLKVLKSYKKTSRYDSLIILKNPKRLPTKYSVGRAIRLGLNWANTQFIITMDGDLSHTPIEAYQIFEKLKNGYDLVIGGRYSKSQKPFEPISRYRLSKTFNFCVQLLYGETIKDYTTGFRGFSKDLFDTVNLHSDGFEIHPEINIKLSKKSKKTIELPIHYIKRKSGKSKLKYIKVFHRYLFRILFSAIN